jgi:hypothetical protein
VNDTVPSALAFCPRKHSVAAIFEIDVPFWSTLAVPLSPIGYLVVAVGSSDHWT